MIFMCFYVHKIETWSAKYVKLWMDVDGLTWVRWGTGDMGEHKNDSCTHKNDHTDPDLGLSWSGKFPEHHDCFVKKKQKGHRRLRLNVNKKNMLSLPLCLFHSLSLSLKHTHTHTHTHTQRHTKWQNDPRTKHSQPVQIINKWHMKKHYKQTETTHNKKEENVRRR